MPHLKLYRLSSYSPHLDVVDRLWKLLQQRATHNRLFGSGDELQGTLRKHLDWLQAHRPRSAPSSALSSERQGYRPYV